MNLRQAQYIMAIAQEGGITPAARKLYVSQPSLSQMLRQVEEEIGLPLFERRGQRFRPTYAGESYLEAARKILSANEMLEQEIRELHEEARGRLHLGISHMRAAYLLPELLARFVEQYPLVSVELNEAGSAKLERMLREGQIDLALASCEPGGENLTYELVEEETIGILAGEGSALSTRLPNGTPVCMNQLGEGKFVSLKQGHNLRVLQDQLFRYYAMRPQIFLETDSIEAAWAVTRHCGCYMLCSKSHLAPESLFYPLEGFRNRRHFYACYPTERRLPKYGRAFIELAKIRCRA